MFNRMIFTTYILCLTLSNFFCFGYVFNDIRLKKNKKFRLKKEKQTENIPVSIKVDISISTKIFLVPIVKHKLIG